MEVKTDFFYKGRNYRLRCFPVVKKKFIGLVVIKNTLPAYVKDCILCVHGVIHSIFKTAFTELSQQTRL